MDPDWRCISYIKNKDIPTSYVSLLDASHWIYRFPDEMTIPNIRSWSRLVTYWVARFASHKVPYFGDLKEKHRRINCIITYKYSVMGWSSKFSKEEMGARNTCGFASFFILDQDGISGVNVWGLEDSQHGCSGKKGMGIQGFDLKRKISKNPSSLWWTWYQQV